MEKVKEIFWAAIGWCKAHKLATKVMISMTITAIVGVIMGQAIRNSIYGRMAAKSAAEWEAIEDITEAGGGVKKERKNKGKSINMNDFLAVRATGYQGYGEVEATIDWDSLWKEYGEALGAKNPMNMMPEETPALAFLEYYVKVEVEGLNGAKNKCLSNGDTVAYKWTIDPEIEEYTGAKVTATDGEFQVKGLKQAPTFDAFEDIEVEFTGKNGEGVANVRYTGEILTPYNFWAENTEGLSNGDEVIVSLTENDPFLFISICGKMPEANEKRYTVKGLE